MIDDFQMRRGEPLLPSYRRFIVNSRGEWLATLVGREDEALEVRAQRFAKAVRGSRAVGREEFDALRSRLREGYIPIGRRAAA